MRRRQFKSVSANSSALSQASESKFSCHAAAFTMPSWTAISKVSGVKQAFLDELVFVTSQGNGHMIVGGNCRASDKCQREKRKTINGDDLIWAMSTLGFEEYVEPLKLYLHKYREVISRSWCHACFQIWLWKKFQGQSNICPAYNQLKIEGTTAEFVISAVGSRMMFLVLAASASLCHHPA